MKTQQFLEEKTKSKSFRFSVKLMTIGFIILILLIPKMMIMGVIHERKMTSESAQMEVHRSWSYEQTVRGPILSIPYIEKIVDKDGELVKEDITNITCFPKH